MRIGIDLGGTKIEGVALGRLGEILARRRVPTPRHDYEGTLRAVVELVEACEREGWAGDSRSLTAEGRPRGVGPAPVGLGHPGAISPATGLIKNSNSVWLNGRPLAHDLQARLRRPLRLANDANCFALSEAVDGAGRDGRVVFGVILGTGTGGGLVVDRSVLVGPNAVAGEWGHNPMPWPRPEEWPGPACYCGRSGCIECFLSGPGMERDYASCVSARPEVPRTEAAGPGDCSAEAIVASAEAGDPAAETALQRYTERLARALASVVNLCDPDIIVLGGGMSNIARLYREVPKLWGAWVFSDRVDTVLARAQHGDSSGVRGAAWLWPEGPEP